MEIWRELEKCLPLHSLLRSKPRSGGGLREDNRFDMKTVYRRNVKEKLKSRKEFAGLENSS